MCGTMAEIVSVALWTDAKLGAAVRAHQARRRHASRRRTIRPVRSTGTPIRRAVPALTEALR